MADPEELALLRSLYHSAEEGTDDGMASVSSRWCRTFQVPHYVKKFSVIITHWDTQTLNMVTIRIGHATHVTVKYIRTMVR